MNVILSEKEYQKSILQYLKEENGYVVRDAKNFDRLHAMDRELLMKFLNDTQPEDMQALKKVYKDDLEETIVNFLNNEVTKTRGSLIETLKNGINVSNRHLDLMYTKPATDFNKELLRKYQQNIFSVMEEVWASDKERIDLVIFLNGIAIMSFELKCNAAGQTYHDAILQYRKERDPSSRLFLWKAGCIVNFAMDLEEVYMTTKLDGEKTYFMPFNMGRGEGVDAGAGNPTFEDKYSVSYMWEDILTKDTILDLLSKFIFVERKEQMNEETGRSKVKETVIFPRFHQLDLIRKLLADVKENGTSQNYLIEHSAGSGKTNSIAWLTYRLTSLHDENNRIIYDNIIIMTDRVIVDRQLQAAILGMDHKAGMIRVMDDSCSSADLAYALQHNTKVIATTIQKFPYIVDTVRSLHSKTFAVIIDEAHSSTAGKDMQAVAESLSTRDSDELTADDVVESKLAASGKPENVSMFAFTATPKPTTLRRFGRLNPKGEYQAFHLYSMKQAIEEGYILDVLANYTTYKTMYTINKEIQEDPLMKTSPAKREISRFIDLHDTNIAQRVHIIIEHFKNNVMKELNGQAKAMVITKSRAAAVKYRQAFEEYVTKKGYTDIHALVAFTGKVILSDDETQTEYTERAMNNMDSKQIPEAFDSDNYNVLIVADKYQTGFDQKKLCAMYIMKKLRGVKAVQTLGRLNRVCPPYEKKVFVLDFVNDYEDMQKAFEPFYTTTLLKNDLTPNHIYDLEVKIDAYHVLDPLDIDRAYDLIFKKRKHTISKKEQRALITYFRRAEDHIKALDQGDPEKKKQRAFRKVMKSFLRFYEYLMQVSCLEDPDLYKKYVFVSFLYRYLDQGNGGGGFDLKGKIRAENFVQEKTGEHKGEQITSDPVVKLPTAEAFNLTQEKEKHLSEIIAEINSRTGKNYDNDVAVKSMLQVRDIMMKSDTLKKSAKNNTEKDFEFSYYDSIDDALIEGLSQNQDFFSLLLNNDDIKKQVMGLFADEIYKSLRGENRAYQIQDTGSQRVAER